MRPPLPWSCPPPKWLSGSPTVQSRTPFTLTTRPGSEASATACLHPTCPCGAVPLLPLLHVSLLHVPLPPLLPLLLCYVCCLCYLWPDLNHSCLVSLPCYSGLVSRPCYIGLVSLPCYIGLVSRPCQLFSMPSMLKGIKDELHWPRFSHLLSIQHGG